MAVSDSLCIGHSTYLSAVSRLRGSLGTLDQGREKFEYIEVFYNRKRLHSTFGYRSHCQMLSDWCLELQKEKQVACLLPLEGEKPREPQGENE